MSRFGLLSRFPVLPWMMGLFYLGFVWMVDARATQIVLKDGRVLEGKFGMVASLAEQPSLRASDGTGPLQLIGFLDDDLRRTFFSKRRIQEVREGSLGGVTEKFAIHQRVARGGRTVKNVGGILKVQPFDEFGRRILTMRTVRGPVDVIQAITEMTPEVTRVQGVTHVWDMRMATSSLPREILGKILAKQTKQDDVEERKKIARFYLQAERYEDALEELKQILADFPDDENTREQLEPSIRQLHQLAARRLLKELELRHEAGQHRLVFDKLKKFPSENVAGEILQAVQERIREYENLAARRAGALQTLEQLTAKIEDPGERENLEPIVQEIRSELNLATLGRMAAFLRLADDKTLLPSERVSLAVSGWLLGSNTATVKLPVSLSAYTVRDLVRRYLNEPLATKRDEIFNRFGSEEAASPRMVAELLAHMKPPGETPEQDAEKPGYFELEVPGIGETPPVRYWVQLPPEYDPYRRYPTIVTLHGAGTTPSHQIDWWAGAWTKGGWRAGQATRHGYIVLAPQWTTEHQKRYGYTAREHAAVLLPLRDACRRFSIDADRVFLSGHSIGGDAAWDVGLAHPDLWAGVIPISAQADRYCALYWENAKLLPMYFILGELDGGKMNFNARDLDRYLTRGYDCTVVEFLGRGHEHFHDEILRLFDWMGRQRRDFFPQEFTCVSMRPWDKFFWWVEVDHLPPKSMIPPDGWPIPRGTQATPIKASLTANNGINLRTGAGQVTVWVSPKMVDFEQRVNIVVNGQRINGREPFLEPRLRDMLEDARTRGDRQHPFWLKVDHSTGRVRVRP